MLEMSPYDLRFFLMKYLFIGVLTFSLLPRSTDWIEEYRRPFSLILPNPDFHSVFTANTECLGDFRLCHAFFIEHAHCLQFHFSGRKSHPFLSCHNKSTSCEKINTGGAFVSCLYFGSQFTRRQFFYVQ
jgi:hypothetical protein